MQRVSRTGADRFRPRAAAAALAVTRETSQSGAPRRPVTCPGRCSQCGLLVVMDVVESENKSSRQNKQHIFQCGENMQLIKLSDNYA